MLLLPSLISACLMSKRPDTSSFWSESSDTGTCTTSPWYADEDGDGYGNSLAITVACDQPEGTVSTRPDCDDTRAEVYPGADEVCGDGLVNDCRDDDGVDAQIECDHLSLSLADARLIGEEAGDYAGHPVTGAGDVNGDGWDDLLVGVSGRDPEVVYLVSGPVIVDRDLGTADAQVGLEESRMEFGNDGLSAGDVDGDGYSDMLLGVPQAETAYLFQGPVAGELSPGDADASLVSLDEDATGDSTAVLGDVDGDGVADLLVGAPDAQGPYEESTAGGCATEVDVGGDDHGHWAGAAWLFLDVVSGSVQATDADARLIGEDGDDGAGAEVAAPGDLDGDGLADLFLNGPANCEGGAGAGAAYVVLSAVRGEISLADADAKLIGAAASGFGGTISGAGDTNGDGTPDLLASSPFVDDHGGEVYLFLGPVSASRSAASADAKFLGSEGSYAGYSLSGAGDVDADGLDDIVIGAWGQDNQGNLAGATFILHGPLTGRHELMDKADLTFLGAAGDRSGSIVAGAVDLDGDGLSDVLTSVPGDDSGGEWAGAVDILLGGGAMLNTPPGI